MHLIVGLGNPGPEYAHTRHNAGFMALDALVKRHALVGERSNFHGRAVEGRIANEKCLLLWPMTFMNRSGLSVRAAMDFYKIEPIHTLVIVDDTALPIGRIRLRKDGSPGGHNGLKDIERALGTDAYPRLRIGIDTAASLGLRQPLHDYVLSRFAPEQLAPLSRSLDKSCAAVEAYLRDGIEKTMTVFNASDEPPA
ncbi:MAG: aminoacyl-tRNA hydrolase [Phycisphaera sp.]|nr:aminoacyl-tRNA hydrolase [Phycisphaera sp.]